MGILRTLTKIAIVLFVAFVNFVAIQPAWADHPDLTQTSEYAEVTQTLESLLQGRSDLTPEETQRQIGTLQLQKYILETATNWTQVTNQTDQNLAIYAHKGKKTNAPIGAQIYYLASDQTTDDDWNVDGIYLASGTKVAGLTTSDQAVEDLVNPVIVQFVSGAQVIAKTNDTTGAIEFNLTPSSVITSSDNTWKIPDLASADIATARANAPIDD